VQGLSTSSKVVFLFFAKTRRYYYNGSATAYYNYLPITITISKTGYKTRTVLYSLDRTLDGVEVLEPSIPIFNDISGKLYLNIKPTDGGNKLIMKI
jgi:hypothetical protein